MVAAQGGDLSAGLPVAEVVETVTAERGGFVSRLDARAVGVAAWRLGAGRARKEDPVSATAGVVCVAKPGDAVEAGDTVLELHTDDRARLAGAREALAGAIDIADAAPPPAQLIAERVG
jgi:thymidine phosphorylase